MKTALIITMLLLAISHAYAAPFVIAHRGGTGDAPENTLAAFHSALRHGADALWMTVQLSQDGVPVLYRPGDLAALTDGHGKVNAMPLSALQKLDAAYRFRHGDASQHLSDSLIDPLSDPESDNGGTRPLRIPTLRAALLALPQDVPLMLDMKQKPVAPLVAAVAAVLDELHAWSRVRLYSTDAEAVTLMKSWPQAQIFETRDATRDRLVTLSLGGVCENPPAPGTWVGIELHRHVDVIEHFTLGEGLSHVDAHWWTPAAVACFRSRGDVHIVAFGVDSAQDFKTATDLTLDAVMTDSPKTLREMSHAH